MIGTLGQFVREIRDLLTGSGDPIPVDIGTNIDVTIDNTSIEVSNDVGNPIPVSDGGGSLTVDGPLTDAQLRNSVVPTAPNITRAGGAVDSNTQRITLATDSPGISALGSIAGLTIPAHDHITLSYTGINLTGVVYRTGGSGGTTVGTLTLAYNGSNQLTSVTKS
jgi:hypothetical protein